MVQKCIKDIKLPDFKFGQSGRERYWRDTKRKQLLALIKDAPRFYSLSNDPIANEPLTTGVYEPRIKALIDFFALHGYSDFLLDIGANIGLTSYQSGALFKEIHLFEPNPNCHSILRMNLNFSLARNQYEIHEYGLGTEDKIVNLMVPKQNIAGAFIRDEENSYSTSTLLKKDGLADFDLSNYDSTNVEIKNTKEVLSGIFSSFQEKGYCGGVIKVDVEGYELTIIAELLSLDLRNFQVLIVFESWDEALDLTKLKSANSIEFFKLTSHKKYNNILQRLLKKISPYFAPLETYFIEPLKDQDLCGDLIIKVN